MTKAYDYEMFGHVTLGIAGMQVEELLRPEGEGGTCKERDRRGFQLRYKME